MIKKGKWQVLFLLNIKLYAIYFHNINIREKHSLFPINVIFVSSILVLFGSKKFSTSPTHTYRNIYTRIGTFPEIRLVLI